MSEEKKWKEFWITRHKDGPDKDRLTHIVLFEYYEDANPLHVIEYAAVTELQSDVEELKIHKEQNLYRLLTINKMEMQIKQLEAENNSLRNQNILLRDALTFNGFFFQQKPHELERLLQFQKSLLEKANDIRDRE